MLQLERTPSDWRKVHLINFTHTRFSWMALLLLMIRSQNCQYNFPEIWMFFYFWFFGWREEARKGGRRGLDVIFASSHSTDFKGQYYPRNYACHPICHLVCFQEITNRLLQIQAKDLMPMLIWSGLISITNSFWLGWQFENFMPPSIPNGRLTSSWSQPTLGPLKANTHARDIRNHDQMISN